MRELLLLDALGAALRQGGALVHRDARFVLVMQGRELARGEHLQDLALTLSVQGGTAPRRGPLFLVWLGRDLLHDWGDVKRSRESLSAFIRAAMHTEITARRLLHGAVPGLDEERPQQGRKTPCAQ